MRMECAKDTHGFTQGMRMVSRNTSLIPSPLTNAYIDAFVPAVLWPGRAESIHLRTSAVLSRDPRQTVMSPDSSVY
jgi:hypothetical protein